MDGWNLHVIYCIHKCRKGCRVYSLTTNDKHLLFTRFSKGVSANIFCWPAAVSTTKGDYPTAWLSPPGSKFLIAAVMVAVSAAIFLCPLYIQTQCPCLTEELPKKPDLIGHRGAPMVSVTLFSTTPREHTCRRDVDDSYSLKLNRYYITTTLYVFFDKMETWRTLSCTITNRRIFILSKHMVQAWTYVPCVVWFSLLHLCTCIYIQYI